MRLPQLIEGRLVKRYQRFLADVTLADGSVVTAHCPNSGSMKGCAIPGARVWLSRSDNQKRRLAFTWELAEADGCLNGINTGVPNRLVREAIEGGTIAELQGYDSIRQEVPYGERSRIDLLLTGVRGRCYVEVKNVTLVQEGRARFPDAVTERGQKHLAELMRVVRAGDRGVLVFTVQRADGHAVSPADDIDPVYGRLLRQAMASGVEVLAYRAAVTPEQIRLAERLPVIVS
jgi:sugar fermentation stimulation protein A